MPEALNRVRFPIGDWSGDGHRDCEWYTVLTNKTKAELVAAHEGCVAVFGFDPGELCKFYEEACFTEPQTRILQPIIDRLGLENADYDGDMLRFYPADTKDLLLIWLEMLKAVDPTLTYAIDEVEESMTYGVDVPGYGLLGN